MKIKLAESASEHARTILPKLARKYFEAGRKAIEGKRPPEELHEFRLETKRFRYTLELFRPLYGPNLDRNLKSLRELQSALGKISDFQAIHRVVAGDHELETHLQHAQKAKLKDLRQSWRAFDSDGELKRWRTYLAGDHSKPRTKPAKPKPMGKAAAKAPVALERSATAGARS
jgi:CHAD domain-containing protein